MNAEVIPSRRWRNKTTGAIASIYGAVPWWDAAAKDHWEIETCGFTIRWPDGTVGIGRKPFETREEAESYLALQAKNFPGMV